MCTQYLKVIVDRFAGVVPSSQAGTARVQQRLQWFDAVFFSSWHLCGRLLSGRKKISVWRL